MLEFEPDEEQIMLVETLGRFAQEELRRVFRDADEDCQIPDRILQTGWEFGLLTMGIPEKYGGFDDYSVVTGVLGLEALGFGDLSIALSILYPNIFAIPILLCGTDSQKEEFLPDFCTAAPPAYTAALTEPVIHFDPRNLSTTATRDDDEYILNGKKSLVPFAQSADSYLIYANETGKTEAFLVSRMNPAVKIGKRENLMGIRAIPTFSIEFEDCRIPKSSKLGGENGIDFDLILNHSRVALGALAVGLARAGYEYALDYAKGRIQFGEPIAHRQSIAFMLAEMATEIDAGRLLVWEAAWQIDSGNDATRDAVVMKKYIDDMVLRIADRAVQILGGYGYVREFPAELWLRNARGFNVFDGLAII